MSEKDSARRPPDDLPGGGLHGAGLHGDDLPGSGLHGADLHESNGRMPPLVISVVGLHNAGKTTIAERLVEGWRQMGLQVGVIKHDGHADDAFARAAAITDRRVGANPDGRNVVEETTDDWEKPGSDTYRYRARGAAFTMVTGGGSTLLRSVHDPHVHNITHLIERMATHALLLNQPLDIILVEGYKKSALPKVVVLHSGDEKWLREADLVNIHAIVTNQMELTTWVADHQCPVYDESNLLDLCHGLWTRDVPGGGE